MTIPQIEKALKILEGKEGEATSPAIKSNIMKLKGQYKNAEIKLNTVYQKAVVEQKNENVKAVMQGKRDLLTLANINAAQTMADKYDKEDMLHYRRQDKLVDFMSELNKELPLAKIGLGVGIGVAAIGAIGMIPGALPAIGSFIAANPAAFALLGAGAAVALAVKVVPAVYKAYKKVQENRLNLEALKADMANAGYEAEEEQRKATEATAIQNGVFQPSQITPENKDNLVKGLTNAAWTSVELNAYLASHTLTPIQRNLLIQAYNEAEPEIKKIKDAETKALDPNAAENETNRQLSGVLTPDDFGKNFAANENNILQNMVDNIDFFPVNPEDYFGQGVVLTTTQKVNYKNTREKALDKIKELDGTKKEEEKLDVEYKNFIDVLETAVDSKDNEKIDALVKKNPEFTTKLLAETDPKYHDIQVAAEEAKTRLDEKTAEADLEATTLLNAEKGRKNAVKKALKDNPDLYDRIKNRATNKQLKVLTEVKEEIDIEEKMNNSEREVIENGATSGAVELVTKLNELMQDGCSKGKGKETLNAINKKIDKYLEEGKITAKEAQSLKTWAEMEASYFTTGKTNAHWQKEGQKSETGRAEAVSTNDQEEKAYRLQAKFKQLLKRGLSEDELDLFVDKIDKANLEPEMKESLLQMVQMQRAALGQELGDDNK